MIRCICIHGDGGLKGECDNMSETPKPYLHLVRSEHAEDASASPASPVSDASDTSEGARTDEGTEEEAAAPEAATEPTPLNQPLQQAIMYAAVSWVALTVERSVYAVDIQPIARRLYEVSVHYCDPETGREAAGEGIILRIALAVEPGLVLRTSVEPVRP